MEAAGGGAHDGTDRQPPFSLSPRARTQAPCPKAPVALSHLTDSSPPFPNPAAYTLYQ